MHQTLPITRPEVQAAAGPVPYRGPSFILSGNVVRDAGPGFGSRPDARTAAPTPAILRAPAPAPEPSIPDRLASIGRQAFAARQTGPTAKPAPTDDKPTSFAQIAADAYASRNNSRHQKG